jgi:hypothetical protein
MVRMRITFIYCQQYFHNDFKTSIIYFQTIENE